MFSFTLNLNYVVQRIQYLFKVNSMIKSLIMLYMIATVRHFSVYIDVSCICVVWEPIM